MLQDYKRRRSLPESPIKPRPEIAAHTEAIRTLIGPGVERLPELRGVDPDQLYPDPEQPRKTFEEAPLRELAEDMQRNGTIQPLVVRPREEGGYWIVVGERRWRAARLAGKATLPCLVRSDLALPQVRRMQLRENLQREDLNPLERAQALIAIREHEGLTWEQVGQEFGYSVRRIHQLVGLTRLPEQAQTLLRENAITAGHAVVLESLPPDRQASLAESAALEHWSVEQLREVVRQEPRPGGSPVDAREEGWQPTESADAPAAAGPAATPESPSAGHAATGGPAARAESSAPSDRPTARAAEPSRRGRPAKELRVQLPEGQHTSLQELANRLNTTPSALTRRILRWALDQAEGERLPWEGPSETAATHRDLPS